MHLFSVVCWDNADEIDRDIKERLSKIDVIRQQIGSSEIKDKLKEKGLI